MGDAVDVTEETQMKRYVGRKLRWTVLFAVIAAAMVVLVPSAIAVHDEAFQLDGEYMGETEHVEFRSIPAALRIIG